MRKSPIRFGVNVTATGLNRDDDAGNCAPDFPRINHWHEYRKSLGNGSVIGDCIECDILATPNHTTQDTLPAGKTRKASVWAG